MLRLQDSKERFAEGFLGAACALTGDRYGFVRAGRCLVLDQVLEVIVVYIDWKRTVVSCNDRGLCQALRHLQWPHSGMLLWRNVSPYFIS